MGYFNKNHHPTRQAELGKEEKVMEEAEEARIEEEEDIPGAEEPTKATLQPMETQCSNNLKLHHRIGKILNLEPVNHNTSNHLWNNHLETTLNKRLSDTFHQTRKGRVYPSKASNEKD
jgi:hypothetical protein